MLFRLIRSLAPPVKWRFPVIVVLGIFTGLVAFTLHVSKATSYLSDRPETCVNCHIMTPQYSTWFHGSHREVSNCNDCHVPHNNSLNKYYFKAKDGMRHATIFTLRKEPQVIFIKKAGQEVVQDNCIRCHSDLLSHQNLLTAESELYHSKTDRKCWECHREVPHGRVNSLSSTPNARVPLLESPVPDWLKVKLNK
jgi:cytochrome c nitrite reductase small subunit